MKHTYTEKEVIELLAQQRKSCYFSAKFLDKPTIAYPELDKDSVLNARRPPLKSDKL